MTSLLSMLRKKLLGGTDAADTLAGTDQAELIKSGGGADTVDGGAGNDLVNGGSGNDRLLGGAGDDLVYGGSGNDTIFGDTATPGFSGGGNDWLFGGDGDDVIAGGLGRNTIDGGGGHDTLYATWDGFAAAELGGPATIDGGSGNDRIFGTVADDVLRGGSGNDVIFGFEGNDRIEGGTGNDDLSWGNAIAPVGVGTLDGGSGDDVLRGGFLTGNMRGGSGNDTLVLGRFNPGASDAPPPTLDGGDGIDTLSIVQRPVFDLTGNDALNLGGIERIDMTGGAPSGQELVLNMAALIGLSASTDTLLVTGDAGDRVTAEGAWLASGTQTLDGLLYNQWMSSSATLLVESDVAVSLVG